MSSQCPHCGSIVYSRRSPLCGVCGKELPPGFLFTPEQRQAVESEIKKMDQRADKSPISLNDAQDLDKKIKNGFGLVLLTLVFLGVGAAWIAQSVTGFQHGTLILFGHGRGSSGFYVSPWVPLMLGLVFLGVGVAGIWKICRTISQGFKK